MITGKTDGTKETETDNITCRVTDENNLDKLSRGILRISPERTRDSARPNPAQNPFYL
jgi:hypothetical protein